MTAVMKRPGTEPTEEQAEIIGRAKAGGNLMVKAYAGCAKSTTLEMAAKKIRVPGLALAFNKSIADELKRKLPEWFNVRTLNGLGFSAWRKGNPQVLSWDIQDRKLGKLITQIAKERGVELLGDQWDSARRLVQLAMQNGLIPFSFDGLVPDDGETWRELGEMLWLQPEDVELLGDIPRLVLAESNRLAREGQISFDDQIYCPTVLGGRWEKFPVVLGDETQDWSPLNHRMVGESLGGASRLIAVGDPKQAIYAFRGADSRSMDSMRWLRPEWEDLGLTMTFRCPKEVVRRQQGHAPGFRAAPSAPEGAFRLLAPEKWNEEAAEELRSWTWEELVGMLERPDGRRNSFAILCRNNAPLMKMAFKLLRKRVGVHVLGREIGKGLQGLVKKLEGDAAAPIGKFAQVLQEWEEKEIDLAKVNDKPEREAGIRDKAECLRAVMSEADVKDVRSLLAAIDMLFSRDAGLVTLSTIHKSKGLEWDIVLHLDPWRVPSKFAKQEAERGNGAPLEQEWNLLYVAETRTKGVLLNGDLEDFR